MNNSEMTVVELSKRNINNVKSCSCIKLVETYTVMEKNLLKIIDLLQYEKDGLIKDYESKMINLEKNYEDLKISEHVKTQTLKKELLDKTIANHDLENSLRLAEENLKLSTLRKTFGIEPNISITSICFKNTRAQNLCALLKNLHSLIISNYEQNSSELRNEVAKNEIQNLFKSIFIEINKLEKKDPDEKSLEF